MKKYCILPTLLLLFFSLSLNSFAKSQDDAFEVALALNYCHMSLYKIIQYNDRIVLDEEYNEIINNINLTKIKDEEIIDLLKSLMDTISHFKLNEGDKELLYAEYENQISNAFYSSFSSVATIPVSGNPYVIAATTLVNVGSAYANYRNNMELYKRQLKKSTWELDKKVINTINDVRKDFISSYWLLMKRYNIPDKWRITEKQMDQFITILKDSNSERKYRNLRRLEDDFEAYPPFWYYLGQAAQDLKDYKYALKAYDKLDSSQKGFFREDNIYASALMNQVSLLDSKKDRNKIIKNLSIINTQSPLDYRKNIFSALWYINLGNYNSANERLQINIDNDKNSSINRQLIGDVYSKKHDKKQYNLLLDEMLNNNKICNQEILYLLGKEPELKTIQKIRNQILNIYVVIKKRTLRQDDVIITVPDKWILWDNKYFEINMIIGEKEYPFDKITIDKEKKLISYYFEKVIDSDDIMKNRKKIEVKFKFISTAYPVTLIGDLMVLYVRKDKGYMSKKYDSIKDNIDKGFDKTKDYASKGYNKTKTLLPWTKDTEENKSREHHNDQKSQNSRVKTEKNTMKTVYFVGYYKREIRTNENCYRITEKNEIAKCK